MDKLFQLLEGKKTLGVCALGIGIIAAVHLHWLQIDPQQLSDLKSGIILAAIAALRVAK